MINICEIFKSIQGESTHAGRICTFVRLTGCNLHCSYCDTLYAETESTPMTIEQIVSEVKRLGSPLVEITGGEPLHQPLTPALCTALLAAGFELLMETNGSYDIGVLDSRVKRIVDIKLTGSGCGGSFFSANCLRLTLTDEVKFVIGTKEDFEEAIATTRDYGLTERCTVLFSPVMPECSPALLAEWILSQNNPKIRMGLQIHKFIWGEKRGV